MTQDCPEAQTWTDFEEDCDAVNQARASKIQRQRIQRVPTCFRQESSTGGRCRFGMWRSRPRRSEPAAELAQQRSMIVRRIALQASLALDHKRRWKRALHHAAKHFKGELHVGQPLWFWRRGANAAKKPTNAFWHPGVVISNTLTTVRDSPPRFRSQVCNIPGATVSRR